MPPSPARSRPPSPSKLLTLNTKVTESANIPKRTPRNCSVDKGYGRYSKSEAYDKRGHEHLSHEIIRREGVSQVCLVISLILAVTFLIAMVIIKVQISGQKRVVEVRSPIPYAMQTTRKQLAVISDNAECAVYFKSKLSGIPGLIMQEFATFFMMCLHLTEPHTVAPDSTVSYMYQYNQNNQQLAASAKNMQYITIGEVCKPGNPRNMGCHLMSRFCVVNGDVQIEGDFTEGMLRSNIYTYADFTYLNRYSYFFSLMSGSEEDSGFNEYEDAMLTNYYDNAKDATIRIPLARNVKNFEKQIRQFLVIPKGPTLSLISGVIVKAVHDTLINMELGAREKEDLMYTLIAYVHKIVIDLLPDCREWTGYGSERSIIDRIDEITDVLRKFLENVPKNEEERFDGLGKRLQELRLSKGNVMRLAWDRVSSAISWQKEEVLYLNVASFGLPDAYKSSHYGKTRGKPGRFSMGKDKSQPFMSSAGLIIREDRFKQEFDQRPTHVVTSSGSVRTVDAVVIPLLRMLLLHDEPGKAVYAPAVFYHPDSQSFVCEPNGTVSHPEFNDHLERIRQTLEMNKVPCRIFNKKFFEAEDRASFAMTSGPNETDDIVAAVDPRHSNQNNYPAGR